MSLIANAKAKALKGNVSEAFKNEEGAIDLASIMVGIIVIGLIGGVIAATVFAVIPWAQDNAAKQQLDSVASAQAAYVGLSADKGDAHFGGSALTAVVGPPATYSLVTADAKKVGGEPAGATAITESLFNGGSAKIQVGQWGTGNGAHYAAATKSQSGKTFYISDTKTQPDDAAKVVPAVGSQLEAVVNAVKGM